MILDELSRPIVLAPLAGGLSTPELTAAVSNAGGFGFLAGGYLAPVELAARMGRTRALTSAPIGVNLFVPGAPSPRRAVTDYADRLAGEAQWLGTPLGTAFLRCPEAGTSTVHRHALGGPGGTALTRAFTGRLARGIRNRFLDEHGAAAPAAYPEIHYLTAPLRNAARRNGDPDLVNLWAGQTYQLGRDLPAADLVRLLAAETTAAVATPPTTVARS